MTGSTSSALKNGEDVSLVGSGTFAVKVRAAREGCPRTGTAITSAIAKQPSFRPGKSLKDAVS
ncbi:HU family DNA-binding protein [Pseudomonas sp. MBLB4136]|uniref:HU family DNA-binding protein n=1 Tax=Pseudomonas sp. MBLB4136 TaxID=3451558 RepID=UPI003F755A81